MEKYILQILQNNNRVIVPEFGAFIVKQRNPLIVIFNEFLQYNDGMLVDFVAKEKNLSRDDAKLKIDQFVKEISSAVDSVGEYSLGSIGTIQKSAAGKISIEKTGTAKKAASKSSQKQAETPKKSAAKEPEKKAAQAINKDEVEVKTEKESKDTAPKAPAQNTEEKKDSAASTKPTTEPAKSSPKTADEVKTEQKPKEVQESPKKPTPPPPAKPVTEEKKVTPATSATAKADIDNDTAYSHTSTKTKRSRKSVILWFVVILLVNGGLISYFIYSGDLQGLFKSEDETELSMDYYENEVLMPDAPEDDASAANAGTDAENGSEIGITATEPEAKPGTQAKPAAKKISGTKYYVVAGVFRSEQNADNLVIDLNKKGYNAEKFGTIGSLHAVSYDVFETKSEADRFLKKIHSEMDSEAWIRIVK